MEVFIARITPLLDVDVFQEKLKLVPGERQEKIARFRFLEDRCRGLGAGLLLEYGLNRRGLTLLEPRMGLDRVDVAYTEFSKPYICGDREIWFNLSHAGDYAAAVFSSSNAGIDIEERQKADAGMDVARRFFMAEEYARLEAAEAQERLLLFTQMWTRKESYMKAVGSGLSLPMDSFSVMGERITGAEDYWLRTFRLPEGYCLSVCAREKIETLPQEINLLELFDAESGNHYNA